VARVGDWDGGRSMFASISKLMFDTNWEILDTIEIANATYSIAKHKRTSNYVVGEMVTVSDDGRETERFGLVFHIEMNEEPVLGAALGYPNLYSVFSVIVKEGMRGLGFSKMMYRWLVARGITIIGDKTQYFGARRLWAALSQQTTTLVDIVDVKTKTVVERDVTLHHGNYDHDFDQRVWSYGQDKANLRVVLREIIR
jgi:hypothetical protein